MEGGAGKKARLVVDTNVLLEQLGMADLERTAETPDFYYRADRARDSIILAWYLHRRGWQTGTVSHEFHALMLKNVPPDVIDVPRAFTTVVGHYVLPFVVSGWKLGGFIDVPLTLKSTEVDDYLLKAAKEDGIPLITNEGNGPNGISSDDPKKLRWKAEQAGVRVFTPGQYLRDQGVDYERSANEFLKAYDRQLPRFQAEKKPGDGLVEACRIFRELYEWVLLRPGPTVPWKDLPEQYPQLRKTPG